MRFLKAAAMTAAAVLLASCGGGSAAPTPPATSRATPPSTQAAATGTPGPSAPAATPAPTPKATDKKVGHVGGTITWDALITEQVSPDFIITTTVKGTINLVMLAERSYGFTAERGGGSTYTYDYTVSNCSPAGHFTGALETSVQGQPVGSTIGNVLPQGAPGQDMALAIQFNDEWQATCEVSTSMHPTPFAFPGCHPETWVDAPWKGDIYVINCETSLDAGSLKESGHVSGTLHPLD